MGDVETVNVYPIPVGDAPPPPVAPSPSPSLQDVITSNGVKTASAIALTYHGYARTGSILWALVYMLAGRTVPAVAVPIAIAQGFGKRKVCNL